MKKLALIILIIFIQIQKASAQQLTYTHTLVPFTSVVNEWSDVQSFTISGSNLPGHLYIVGDAEQNFFISLSPDGFTMTDKYIEIAPVSGSVNVTIYVRAFSTTASSYTGAINVQAIGLMDQPYSVSGTTSTVTAITFAQNQNLQIYPNPTSDYLLSVKDLGNYEIVDILGNTILKSTTEYRIDVSILQKGYYVLRTESLTHKFYKK